MEAEASNTTHVGGESVPAASTPQGRVPLNELWSRKDLASLYSLKGAFDTARSIEDIVDLLTDISCPLVGATNAAVGVVRPRDNALHVYQGSAATAGNAELRVIDLDDPTPLTDVIRTEMPLIIRSFDEFADAYPPIAARIERQDLSGMPTFPLIVDNTAIGSLFFRFRADGNLDDHDLGLMYEIARITALAVVDLAEHDATKEFTGRLEQSNRDLENFAAVIAHDLSAPVRRIGSFMTLLRRELDPMPEKAARRADIITKEITHLNRLLHDILAYSQAVGGHERREPVDLNTVMAELVATLRDELGAAPASIRFADLPVVDVAPALVGQVFANLVGNAIKYRRPDRAPVIEVEAVAEAVIDNVPWWRLTVCDNGVGIAAEHLEDIFSMFMRVPTTEDRPGTGVGLAFAKRVIEGHGGELTVESTPGEGTTFALTLPGRAAADVL